MIKMPFGKHAGKRVDQLPKGYLRWLERECSLSCELFHAVQHVLYGTPMPKPEPDAEDVIRKLVPDFETQLEEVKTAVAE